MAFAKKPANLCKFKFKMTTSTSCKGCNFLTKADIDERLTVRRSWIFKLRFTKNRTSKDFSRKKFEPLATRCNRMPRGGVLEGVDCISIGELLNMAHQRLSVFFEYFLNF